MSRIEPFFLSLESGRRFCVLHRPDDTAGIRGAVLFVHAFAEEMNKSRRMAALQARAFAHSGWIALQIDLFGCGDSAGDFGEATWEGWSDDVVKAAAWVHAETGHLPILWGLRAGCLLVTKAAGSMRPTPDILLWQPATSGKQSLQQFLRLKVAKELLGGHGGERFATQHLREQIAHGATVEVAGYALSAKLVSGMEAAELQLPADHMRVGWFELSSAEGNQLSPVARMRIQSWRDAGHLVAARVVTGPAFWQTQEIVECPGLVESTLSVVHGWQT